MSSLRRAGGRGKPEFTGSDSLLGGNKSDLERDSGFSDASSEYLSAVDLTDSEDAGRIGGSGVGGRQVAVMSGSYGGLSPMIIMNNFVLKQSSPMEPAEKPWGFPAPVEGLPPSQVVLLQPLVSNASSENVRQSKSGILKSYPRIAPHPAEVPTKRSGSSRSRVTGSDRRPRTHHRSHGSPSPQPVPDFDKCPSSPPLASGSLLPDVDELRTDGERDDAPSTDGNKRKRFSNTYNILDKSGLLGITMRTKQLIKENKNTQGQLHLLQEQTALLLEALGSGDPRLWTKLQLSLQQTQDEPPGEKTHRV